MFQIIKSDTKINFAGMFKYAGILSTVLVLISLGLIFSKMKYGVDFRGGAELQTKFTEKVDLNKLRSELSTAGFNGISVQSIGELSSNEYLIKVPGNEENLNQVTEDVTAALTSHWKEGVEIRKVDIVGPKAGAELRQSGFLAMLWALLAIMVYIGLRFDFKYSPGAIIALFHDVTIVLGIFALTGTEFTLQTVAAILAVIGYSVNDTVIVYDRVREHEAKFVGKKLVDHINNATNETLSRTILTSGTTLFVSISMLLGGGLAIRDFFMAFTMGIIIGTYSSIFVAAPITLVFDKYRKKSESNTSGTVNA